MAFCEAAAITLDLSDNSEAMRTAVAEVVERFEWSSSLEKWYKNIDRLPLLT